MKKSKSNNSNQEILQHFTIKNSSACCSDTGSVVGWRFADPFCPSQRGTFYHFPPSFFYSTCPSLRKNVFKEAIQVKTWGMHELVIKRNLYRHSSVYLEYERNQRCFLQAHPTVPKQRQCFSYKYRIEVQI